MKTSNKIQVAIAVALAAVWSMVIIYSFICQPSTINAYGYYSDPIDNEFATQIVAKYGEIVANFYQPLSWLIEPHDEGENSIVDFFSMQINLAIASLSWLLALGFDKGFKDKRKGWLCSGIMVALLVYALSYVMLALF